MENIINLSIVIPTFHHYDGLVECVNSIYTIGNIPININFKIIDNNINNIGCASAWNKGFEDSIYRSNNYTLFINDDVKLNFPIDDLIITLLNYPELYLLSAIDKKDYNPEEQRPIIESAHYSCFIIRNLTYYKLKEFEDENFAFPDNNYQLKNGFFDDNIYPVYFEDSDFSYRLKLAGLKEGKATNLIFDHYGSHSKQFDQNHNENFTKNRDYYVLKWGGLPNEEIYTKPFNLK